MYEDDDRDESDNEEGKNVQSKTAGETERYRSIHRYFHFEKWFADNVGWKAKWKSEVRSVAQEIKRNQKGRVIGTKYQTAQQEQVMVICDEQNAYFIWIIESVQFWWGKWS